MLNRRSFLKSTSIGLFSLSSLSVRCAEKQDRLTYLVSHIESAPDFDYIVNVIRDQLVLESGLAYLNTGSLGTCPAIILEYIYDLLYELEKNPVSMNWGPLGSEMENVREKVAAFIGAEKEEIILTRNTTEGMNCIGSSYKFRTGDEILTTNHEHPGGMVCWEYSAKMRGANIKTIEMPYPVENKEQVLTLIEDNITPSTKICSFSHVSTITGLRMPLKEISEITRPKGILLVCDGAQAPGMLKIDVKDLGVDIYSASGHKWMMAPKETGFLYIRKEVQEKIKPVFTYSGYGSYSASSGTRSVVTVLGLGMAIDIQNSIGPDRIEKQCRKLSGLLYPELMDIPGLEMISPKDEILRTALLSTIVRKGKNSDIKKKLEENHVIVKVLPKYNALRFSTHYFNVTEEIEYLLSKLPNFLNA